MKFLGNIESANKVLISTIDGLLSENVQEALEELNSNIISGGELGSIPYQSTADNTVLLNPNITTTQKFLSMTGTGSEGAIPAWSIIQKLYQPDGNNGFVYTDNDAILHIDGDIVQANGSLTIENNRWLKAKDYAGTGIVNMFKVNENNEIDIGGTLNIGTLNLSEDSGAVTLVNMPVSSAPDATDEMSYSFSLDSNVIAKVYAEADGSGGTQNEKLKVFKEISVIDEVIGSTLTIDSNGITSYESGTASILGTASYPFHTIYGNNIYDNNVLLENKYLGISANAVSATKLATARTITISGDVDGSASFDGSANITITTTVDNDSHTHDGRYYTETESDGRFVNVTGDSMSGDLTIDGTLYATSKSFRINHPTKKGKKLTYASLEGPEQSVFIRGKITDDIIRLPRYWKKLVDISTISVQLTPIKKFQKLIVVEMNEHFIRIKNKKIFSNYINCSYFIQAERKDIKKLEVESE